MDKILIKLTATGYQNSAAYQSFATPRTLLINPYKIFRVMANNKGLTEIVDESGRNVIIVKETPEEIYELINN